MTYLYIAIGGAAGAVMRYLISSQTDRLFTQPFPYGTLAVNLIGALAMGVLIGVMSKLLKDHALWHPLLAIGFLGGFTTFSTFALDAVTLATRQEILSMGLYVFVSVAGSIAALIAGMGIMRMV